MSDAPATEPTDEPAGDPEPAEELAEPTDEPAGDPEPAEELAEPTDEPAGDPELAEPTLRTTKPWVRGYRQGEVDEFVTDLRRAYASDPPTMAPYEVADQRFRPTRFGKGYTMRSVDAYLENAREQLRLRHGQDAVASVVGHETPTRHRHFPTELIYLVAAVLIAAIVVFYVLTQM